MPRVPPMQRQSNCARPGWQRTCATNEDASEEAPVRARAQRPKRVIADVQPNLMKRVGRHRTKGRQGNATCRSRVITARCQPQPYPRDRNSISPCADDCDGGNGTPSGSQACVEVRTHASSSAVSTPERLRQIAATSDRPRRAALSAPVRAKEGGLDENW